MNDKFTRLIHKLRSQLRNKTNDVNKVKEEKEVKEKENCAIFLEANKIDKLIAQLEKDRNNFKWYFFHRLWNFIRELALFILCPCGLVAIAFIGISLFEERATNALEGLCSPMPLWGEIIIPAVGVLGSFYICIKTFREIKQNRIERKELIQQHRKYKSLEEIDTKIKSAEMKRTDLNAKLGILTKEIDELNIQKEILDLEISVIANKLGLANDALVDACDLIDSYKLENLLDAVSDEQLNSQLASLDNEGEIKKTSILARVKSDNTGIKQDENKE